MFEPTIPFGEPELMRVSAFRRYLDELERPGVASNASSRLSSLSPSLMADLVRFEKNGNGTEALEVLAACMRHGRDVTVHVGWNDKVVPLSVFPHERLVHSPVPLETLVESRLPEMRVLHVEPAVQALPTDAMPADAPARSEFFPLGALLWELALRGSRDTLLPEIAGPAAYRVAPGLDLGAIKLNGALQAGVERLQRQTTTLRDMTDFPGFDKERAIRLLNALYLQSGLIVSRTNPAAFSDSWFGTLGR